MSGNVRYKRKILSDRALLDFKTIKERLESDYLLDTDYFGIYLESNDVVYGIYIDGIFLSGTDDVELFKEIELFIKMRDKYEK